MFDFVTDSDLKTKVEVSIQYIVLLAAKPDENEDEVYKEESNRVIILYVISIIEAILFFFYEKSKEKIIKTEYVSITNLPKKYSDNTRVGQQLVIAAKKEVEKKINQISFISVVKFFESKKMMLPKTAASMLELNEISNTFHLNKKRTLGCTDERVDQAISLLFHTIRNAPKALDKK